MAAHSIDDITNDLAFAYLHGTNLQFNLDAASDKVIVFSDLHRGNGGLNDDYAPCDETYRKALQYYLDKNYKLILLGDVEELWENFDFNRILDKYPHAYSLEKKFFNKSEPDNPFYIRCFGNHDYRYAFPELVKDDLENIAGLNGIKVYEGIKMKIMNGGEMVTEVYLSHGHQGHYPRRFDVSHNIAVAAFGALQNITGVATNTSVMDEPFFLKGMRKLTNTGYLKWANSQKIPVVYGHTHEAVFASKRIFDGAQIEVKGYNNEIVRTPNAFNTGCCSFKNGEITGLEIADGKFKLIKWSPDSPLALPVDPDNPTKAEMSIEALVQHL